MTPLAAAIGRYPHTAALFADPRLACADYPVISRAFKPMVRELRFDVSEIAIATFLQAKAAGKPLVLLPVVMAARFQEAALLCLKDAPMSGPADLAGRRVGVRAYSQTTAMWLRGILADDYGIEPRHIQWTTFEDGHVAELADPPWSERAPAGSELMGLLRGGALDAVIVGNDVPGGPDLRTVFPDPAAAAAAFQARHHFTPVNHLVAVRRDLAQRDPALLASLVAAFHAGQAGTGFAQSRAALAPAVGLALRYCGQQGMLPRPLRLEDVWEGLPTAIQ